METHVTPVRTYFFVYIALLILLGATIGAAYLNLGPFNLVITLAIAITKAILVALFFMHVRESSNLVRFFVIAGLLWLVVLVGLTMTDYLARVNLP